ncbi:hypothetical protein [Nonomuraea sp. NPDC049480]|uniref:hypothetical protein n=1 Tax=Nonomuraea sp. NPDC049480 TaxID=3364353 RepID=UPI00378E5AB1
MEVLEWLDFVGTFLKWVSVLFLMILLPILIHRRAVRRRQAAEQALTAGAEPGTLKFAAALRTQQEGVWRRWKAGVLLSETGRMSWRVSRTAVDITGASPGVWRTLPPRERKKLRPWVVEAAITCRHPSLGEFELAAHAEELKAVKGLLSSLKDRPEEVGPSTADP